jgi:Uma2 family endonuclease
MTPTQSSVLPPHCHSKRGEPTWEIALRYPNQGEWTEAEYLQLAESRFVEFSEGCLEFLPMPTFVHQLIVKFLLRLLDGFVSSRGIGEVLFAPLPVYLWPGKYREPDILFLRSERLRSVDNYPHGADLAVEVLSGDPDDRKRDLETKRQEYAAAGISEYWIVDPEERKITVLTLEGQIYRVHGEFGPGPKASSLLLAGFTVSVDAVFAAGEQKG